MENENQNFTEETTEETSENITEENSEVTSEENVYTEVVLPQEVTNQITEMHLAVITGLALFGTMFFFWFLDFVYKKISKLF